MHSVRTDPPAPIRWRNRGPFGFFQRLNAWLVLSLASVALIALLVSGATLNQILPGLFVGQAETRARVAAAATGLLIEDTASRVAPDVLATQELLNTQLLLPVARVAANTLAQG